MRMMLTGLLAIPGTLLAGPLSKFDERKPTAEYQSSATISDIERCLIDMDGWGAPFVYKQHDRPGEAVFAWQKGGDQAGMIGFRIDLKSEGNGTFVKSWMPAKQARDCAPAA